MSESQRTPETPPQNPTVAFERRDVNARAIGWFVVGLAGLIAVSMIVVFGVYSRFTADRAPATQSRFPVAEADRRRLRETAPGKMLPPAPRLDGIESLSTPQIPGRIDPMTGRPSAEMNGQSLDSWQWADSAHTVARIPIADAISRLLAKPADLLKARPGRWPPADNASNQPSASSSGRTPQGDRK